MKDYSMIFRGIFGKTYDPVKTTDHNKSSTELPENHQKSKTTQINPFSLALLGLGGLLSALFILFVDPYNIIFEWKLKFGPGGEIFSIWEKPPVELFLKVYLWNITNSEEYMSGNAEKLKFEEIGPYVYRELLSHENVTFNENGTLTTNPFHPLIWEPTLSAGRREDDLLILPNIALLSIADVVSKKGIFTRLGINVIIRQTNSQPLVQMTAKEFMFGYRSTLMNLGNTFLPSWIYFDKLGLIDRMYEFRGDYETFFTGTQPNNLSSVGILDKYNGQTKIPQWNSPCGDVTGSSDGTKFPSFINREQKLLFFRKSVCRAKELVYVNDTNVDGFNGYRYHFASDTDDNGRIHEKNRCFCNEEDLNECKPNGLLDVRGCYYGFPIALSYPHFLDGDKVLFDKVESGLNPDPAKHKSFFIVEPRSGMPLKLAVRYQINMALGNLKNIANADHFSNMILPMLWIDISMNGLPPSLKMRFKLYLEIVPIAQTCLMYAFFIISIICVIYSLIKFINSRNKNLLNSENNRWIEDDFVYQIDRKLSGYISDRRFSLNPIELKINSNNTNDNSAIAPLSHIV